MDGAERVDYMVPSALSGGGDAVASGIRMTNDPPSARLHLGSEDPDERGTVDVTVGVTFELEGTTYEVVQICSGGIDVLAQP